MKSSRALKDARGMGGILGGGAGNGFAAQAGNAIAAHRMPMKKPMVAAPRISVAKKPMSMPSSSGLVGSALGGLFRR